MSCPRIYGAFLVMVQLLKPAIPSDLSGYLLRDKLQSHFGFTSTIPAEIGTTDRMCSVLLLLQLFRVVHPKKLLTCIDVSVNQQNIEKGLECILGKSVSMLVHLKRDKF